MSQVELQRMTEEWLSETLAIYKDDQSRETIRLRVCADEIRALWQDIAELRSGQREIIVEFQKRLASLDEDNDALTAERDTLKAELDKAKEAMRVKNRELEQLIPDGEEFPALHDACLKSLSAGKELME